MFKNMKIGVRLSLSSGLAGLLLIGVIVLRISRLAYINEGTERIVGKDWVKAELAMTVDTYARANARRTMELFLADSKERAEAIKERMEFNKKTITEALDKLDTLIYLPEGKAMLQKIRDARTAYVVSFTKTLRLLEDGKRDEAVKLLNAETMPLLDGLQKNVGDLVSLQKKVVEHSAVDARNTFEEARTMMIVLGAAALVLLTFSSWWITRSITRPLSLAVKAAEAIADGDLTAKIDSTSRDETGQLLQAMQNMIAKLSQVVSEVNSGAEALAGASEEVSATAQSLSQASSEQAAGVEETSASIEQMTASIAQNTENAKVTDAIATKSAQEAAEGGEAVKATVAAMNQIAKKIGIIDDIAYQTNLLALNAAIEAARAGEHGKGFAVVAAEVRKLAERSQVAAQEIGEVATSSVELAEKAGKLLDEMVPNIKRTSDLVQEITAASEEQSAGVGQINAAVGQLNQTTQQNASSSEELAATAEEMSGQAEQLQQTMSFFKTEGVRSSEMVPRKERAILAKARLTKQNGLRKAGDRMLLVADAPDEAHFTKF
ncbi:MAG TPA: methyl-accepting chemotaxis protein [Noviherbaspirillum sp.]